MPKVTIWVKVEDYEKFIKIKDRPAFLSQAIKEHKEKK